MELVHGAYYWLRMSRNEIVGYYIGQYNRGTGKFDLCGDDLGYDPDHFEVLEMIEYKGNK